MSRISFNDESVLADLRGMISNVEYGQFRGNKQLVSAALWAAVYTIAGVRNFAEEIEIYDRLAKARNNSRERSKVSNLKKKMVAM